MKTGRLSNLISPLMSTAGPVGPFEATSLSSWGDRDRFMGFQTYREGLQGGRGFRHTRGEGQNVQVVPLHRTSSKEVTL